MLSKAIGASTRAAVSALRARATCSRWLRLSRLSPFLPSPPLQLVGTASLLIYKDFVEEQLSVAARSGRQAPGAATTNDGSADPAQATQTMYGFYCAACRNCGVALAVLLLVADWSLGRAVDYRHRKTRKLDQASAL